jgi:hypothetical protein
MHEDAKKPGTQGENEGEGSRSAARNYEQGLKEHLRNADPAAEAERAREDVDARPDEHRRAEEQGKARSAGDLPEDLEPDATMTRE